MFRNDKEKAMQESEVEKIKSYLNNNNIPNYCTDMYSEEEITVSNRKSVVNKKMQEFANAKLVLTDRLHGMIFSAIAGTPCIVFTNNHHKVLGSYEWISYLNYIKFAKSSNEALQMIPELLSMDDCTYNNLPLKMYYDNLAEVIKKYVD